MLLMTPVTPGVDQAAAASARWRLAATLGVIPIKPGAPGGAVVAEDPFGPGRRFSDQPQS